MHLFIHLFRHAGSSFKSLRSITHIVINDFENNLSAEKTISKSFFVINDFEIVFVKNDLEIVFVKNDFEIVFKKNDIEIVLQTKRFRNRFLLKTISKSF